MRRRHIVSLQKTVHFVEKRSRMEQSFVVVDLETTGLNPKIDKIIEIGAIRVEQGEIVDRFESFVNPGVKLSERVSELTGISEDDLTCAPYIEDVLPKFMEFEKELPLVGHKVIFDYSFLKHAAVNLGMQFERTGIDTLRIARCFMVEQESKRLPDLCEALAIEHNPHRAFSDVIATWKLYQFLSETYDKETLSEAGKQLFQPKNLVYQVKKEQKATKRQLERLQRLHEQLGIVPEEDLSRLTRNEASRKYDQIISQYGTPGKGV